jgi:PAS domain S-box-containing protein
MAQKRTYSNNKQKIIPPEALLYSREYDFVINSLPFPVFIYSPQGVLVEANPSAITLLGFNPENLGQKEVVDKLNTHLVSGRKITLKNLPSSQAFKGKVVQDRQMVLRDVEGREHVVLVSASPVRSRGKVICVMVVWHDVTERVAAEDALKSTNLRIKVEVQKQTRELTKSNQILLAEIKKRIAAQNKLEESYGLLEKIFSTTAFLIAFLDNDGRIIRVNHAFAREDGKSPKDYIGKKLFEMFPSPEHMKYVEQTLESGEPLSFYEKEYKFSNHPERGATYWDCNLFPVKDTLGRVEGVIMFLVDRTKLHFAREQLGIKQKELNDSKRLLEIGKLAATVAHELRNPLGAIRVAAYNIKIKAGSPRIESNLANIETKIIESEQIISNLLSYARIKIPRFEPVRISQLLNECIDSALERFSKRKMILSRNILAIKNEVIWADPLQLKEVFHNILNNAFDACVDKEGEIEVRANKTAFGEIRITFQDNGEGIKEELAKKVFEPFFTTKSKGTGLGLSICKQLIDLHDGEILVKSKPGQGASIEIVLPVRAAGLSKARPEKAIPGQNNA